MSKPMFRALSFAAWAAVIVLMTQVYDVNHYTPRGPMYDTGNTVCENDGAGPCGEQFKEDISHLNLTDWQRFLKGDSALLLVLAFVLLAVWATYKANDAPS
jgi:hypothetical protein